MEKLISKIFSEIKKNKYQLEIYEDAFSAIRNYEEKEHTEAHRFSRELRKMIIENMPSSNDISGFFDLYKRTLLFDAVDDFDSYLLYLEINREPKDRFYQPRRKTLKRVVDALQELEDNKLDELFISMPPRIGKTSILMFFLTWILGKHPEMSNLYSAYSDTITKALYNGVLEIINDPVTYLWHDVFPDSKIVQTNSQDETINIDRKKRYPSLTCRSLYGTLNGACDCNGYEISDDLIGGIEEAKNTDRLISAWEKVDNNLLPRAKETAKILWCGTRWSLIDPAGLRMSLLKEDERFKNRRFKIINLPALNENEESNFHYDYNVGFSTEYYLQRRASFEKNNDMASWSAQYMGEPIERSGTLFTPEGFRYYNGVLPDTIPDRIFMAVDPAYGGGDFVAAPICFQYGNDIFVHDVVYSSEDKKITQPLLVNKIIKYEVKATQIEATKATEGYKEDVAQLLKERGYRHNLLSKPAGTRISKEERIKNRAPDIREMMIFLEPDKRSKEYSQFMQNVFGFKIVGKNKHDDAPDSLAMAIDMVCKKNEKAEIFKRKF